MNRFAMLLAFALTPASVLAASPTSADYASSLSQCRAWVAEPGSPAVRILATLEKDGRVKTITVPQEDRAKFSQSEAYRQASLRAATSLYACSPLRFPPKDYAKWKNLQLVLAPQAGAAQPATPEEQILEGSGKTLIPAEHIR